MILASKVTDVATLIAAITGLVAAITASVAAMRGRRNEVKIEDVKATGEATHEKVNGP